VQLSLGRADVGSSAGEFGGDANGHTRRRRRHQFWAGELSVQRARRLIQQQGHGVYILGFQLLQRWNLRADIFDLCRRFLNIEAGAQPSNGAFLSAGQDVLGDLQIYCSAA
jgi:hypothetical protein